MKRIRASVGSLWLLVCIVLVERATAGEPKDADIILKQGRVALEDWYGHFKKGHIQSMTIYYESSVTLDFGHWPSNVPWHGHWVSFGSLIH